jgi:hypothetical protein
MTIDLELLLGGRLINSRSRNGRVHIRIFIRGGRGEWFGLVLHIFIIFHDSTAFSYRLDVGFARRRSR